MRDIRLAIFVSAFAALALCVVLSLIALIQFVWTLNRFGMTFSQAIGVSFQGYGGIVVLFFTLLMMFWGLSSARLPMWLAACGIAICAVCLMAADAALLKTEWMVLVSPITLSIIGNLFLRVLDYVRARSAVEESRQAGSSVTRP